MNEDIVLSLAGITKRFGDLTAVDSVNMHVRDGEIISLLGPSGCGKTTLLRIIAGFEKPSEGVIQIGGVDMASKRPYERNIGLLFQDYALFPHMTVARNIAYGLYQRKWPGEEIAARVNEMLQLIGMQEFADRYPTNLSGGQKQRVALGRALANRPQLILLDEPLSALDAKLRLELRSELKRIIEISGATALVVTHDQEEAMSLAERVVVMNKGRIEQEGSPSHIYHHPDTVFVAEFVGRSNWIVGTPCEKSGDTIEMKIAGGQKLLLKAPKGAHAAKYNVCIRPEALFFLEDDAGQNAAGNGSRPAMNRLCGIIVDSTYLGNSWEIVVDIGEGHKLTVMLNSSSLRTYELGQDVVLGVFADNVILINQHEIDGSQDRKY